MILFVIIDCNLPGSEGSVLYHVLYARAHTHSTHTPFSAEFSPDPTALLHTLSQEVDQLFRICVSVLGIRLARQIQAPVEMALMLPASAIFIRLSSFASRNNKASHPSFCTRASLSCPRIAPKIALH